MRVCEYVLETHLSNSCVLFVDEKAVAPEVTECVPDQALMRGGAERRSLRVAPEHEDGQADQSHGPGCNPGEKSVAWATGRQGTWRRPDGFRAP